MLTEKRAKGVVLGTASCPPLKGWAEPGLKRGPWTVGGQRGQQLEGNVEWRDLL